MLPQERTLVGYCYHSSETLCLTCASERAAQAGERLGGEASAPVFREELVWDYTCAGCGKDLLAPAQPFADDDEDTPSYLDLVNRLRAASEFGPAGDVDADGHISRACWYVPSLMSRFSAWQRLRERYAAGLVGGPEDRA